MFRTMLQFIFRDSIVYYTSCELSKYYFLQENSASRKCDMRGQRSGHPCNKVQILTVSLN